MVVTAANAAADRGANHHLSCVFTARTVAVLRKLVDDLIVGRPNEVSELDLGDRHHAVQRHADRSAHDPALAERGVDHAFVAELVEEPRGDAEYAADFADVLPEHDHSLILTHRDAQRIVDRLNHVHLRHGKNPG